METLQAINFDNQTVISDISETTTENISQNICIDDKLNELRITLNIELNKLNLDSLREKTKELSITGVSKLKKPEIILILEKEFFKLIDILKEKKVYELKNLRKNYGIKRIPSSKKDIIILQILEYHSTNMLFKIDETKFKNDTQNDEQLEETNESLTIIEQLEKQKQEIELKMREQIKKQEEEEAKRILEEERKKTEETKRLVEEEKKRVEDEKREAKKKKQSIPKNVRTIVWNHYIGEDIIKHKCLCCKKVTISNTNFEVGHVLSEKNGGTHEINNLRPICFACNHSMGAENMIDFVIKFGLYIG